MVKYRHFYRPVGTELSLKNKIIFVNLWLSPLKHQEVEKKQQQNNKTD